MQAKIRWAAKRTAALAAVYRLRRPLSLTLFAAAAAFAAHAAWIPAKAQLAQALLQRAWARAQAGETDARPWPWADTHPVARLRVPEHGVDLIVLAGASGRTLAFAPGHISGTAEPGDWGNCVFSGHRDTHFRFLQYVLPGEIVTLETPDRSVYRFQVTARHIVYEEDIRVVDDLGEEALTLLTCFPFDAVVPGGPLRFVVRAEPLPA
jgi:sortase A